MQVPVDLITSLQPFATLVGALLTISMLSILWKENPIYRLCEHLVIGATAAHYIVVSFANTIKPRIMNDMLSEGQYWQILPICLGLMMYFQSGSKYRWMSRMPLAIWVGYGAGMELTMRTFMPLFAQTQATIIKLIVVSEAGFSLFASVSNILFFTVFVLTMIYFFYTFEVLNSFKPLLRAGRWMIMLAYGCSFGSAVTGRVSLFLGRLQFLFGTWLGLIQ